MPIISCTRRVEFDAAHRVMEHESKCKHVHGHRYSAEITCEAKALDAIGRVIDFGVIKKKLGDWIDANWDHTLILWDRDQELGNLVAGVTKQTVFYLPNNPTAENMAAYLLDVVCPQLFAESGAHCKRVRLYETPNCYAEATIKD